MFFEILVADNNCHKHFVPKKLILMNKVGLICALHKFNFSSEKTPFDRFFIVFFDKKTRLCFQKNLSKVVA